MDRLTPLISRGLDSEVASRAVAAGYGITRIKNATLSELVEQFGTDTAQILRDAAKRKPIPSETVERLLQESHGICCLCRDWDMRHPTVIHHIVEHSVTRDDSYSNLVLLCPTHHALAHTTSSIARRPAPPEFIRAAKLEWIQTVTDYLAGRRPKPGSEPTTRTPSPATVVPPLSRVAGRTEESRSLLAALQTHERVLLHGMGGVGKTTLAVTAASHFQRDGAAVLWAGLSTTNGSAGVIIQEWLAQLGGSSSDEPTSAIRSALTARVEAGAVCFACIDGARPEWLEAINLLLLAIPLQVRVLITATHAGLARTLDFAPLHIEPLPTDPAVQLLADRAGREEQELDRAIVEAVGALPLALVLAGRQLAIRSRKPDDQSAKTLLMQIRHELAALDAPGHPGLAAIFRIAYEGMSGDEQLAFRAVSLLASSQFDLPAAAALLGIESEVAEKRLDSLSDANLLDWADAGWYAQHALLKTFGRSLTGRGEQDGFRERHLSHFVALSTALAHGAPESDGRLIEYLPEVVAAANYAAEKGKGDTLRRLVLTYWIDNGVLERRKMLAEAESLLTAGQRHTGRTGDAEALSIYTGHLASVYSLSGRTSEAEALYRKAIELSRSLHLPADEAAHRGNLGMLLSQTGRHSEATTQHSKALRLAIESGNIEAAINQINCLAGLQRRQGMLQEAAGLYMAGLRLIQDAPVDSVNLRGPEGSLLSNLGLVLLDGGQLDSAQELIRSALNIAREVGDTHGEANRLGHLGNIEMHRGNLAGAAALITSALDLATRMGVPALEGTWLMNLGSVRLQQGAIEDARSHYTRALALAESIGHVDLVGQAAANLGRLHEHASEWDSARASYQRSLDAFGNSGGSAAARVRQWLNELNQRLDSL